MALGAGGGVVIIIIIIIIIIFGRAGREKEERRRGGEVGGKQVEGKGKICQEMGGGGNVEVRICYL